MDRPAPRNKLLLTAHADPLAAASICGGLSRSLQGPPGHFQGSVHALVPANKSSSVDEDAALNPAELWQRFVTNAAPLFQQGQPVTGRQKEGEVTDGHYVGSGSRPTDAWLMMWISFICYNYYLASTQSWFFVFETTSIINAGFAFFR